MSEGQYREKLLSVIGKYSSLCMGRFASWTLPMLLRKVLFRSYAKFYGVNESESELPFISYPTFDSFFTRNLVAGSRKVDASPLVSPVDACCSQAGLSSGGKLIQAKGVQYSIEDLLDDAELGREFEGGYYATFYLAPGDYHHIHSPVSAKLVRRKYIPGAFFPVNSYAVNSIPNLFCKNERVSLVLEATEGLLALVMVGAMNVGSINIECEPGFRASVKTLTSDSRDLKYDPPISISIGDRIGTFHLGSTVVLLLNKQAAQNYLPSETLFLGRRVFWGNSLC